MDGLTRIGKEEGIFKMKVLQEFKFFSEGSETGRYGQLNMSGPGVNNGSLNFVVTDIRMGPEIQVDLPDDVVGLPLRYGKAL